MAINENGELILSPGLPGTVDAGTPQDDGGVRVAAYSDGTVRMLGNDGQAVVMNPFLAIDVGQRLIQMGTLQLHNRLQDAEGVRAEQKPRIDIVRGSLPKGV